MKYSYYSDDTVTQSFGESDMEVSSHLGTINVGTGQGTIGGIGDVNSNEKGSGARYNAGKPDFSLIPLSTLEDEARVWGYGKNKYVAWNWAKGMPWSVPLACALRHLAAWQSGEDIDAESGLPHLAHAMCNLRMLTLFSKTYTEGDDRPPKELMP